MDRGKYGYAVRWAHVKPYAYESAMPDKETAQLCFAAPKMLEVLEAFVVGMDKTNDKFEGHSEAFLNIVVLPRAIAAIAAAKGQ